MILKGSAEKERPCKRKTDYLYVFHKKMWKFHGKHSKIYGRFNNGRYLRE